MNTEEEHALAAYFSIRSIPSVMVFREQVLLYNEPGAMDESAIRHLLNYIKDLDMEQVRVQVAEATEQVLQLTLRNKVSLPTQYNLPQRWFLSRSHVPSYRPGHGRDRPRHSYPS